MGGDSQAPTVAVIQARMGSSRLPGKILRSIEGESMLARVVARVRRAQRVDDVIVATSDAPADEKTAAECRRLGVACFRGDEDDVLTRFRDAALAAGAGPVVRITADCPLIDPSVIDRVISAFDRERPDYASNTLERTYPQGLDTEVVSRQALAAAYAEARLPYERAHVTPFIYQRPERFHLCSVRHEADFSGHRWTVDTVEDLELVRAIYAGLAGTGTGDFGWREVLALFARRPELALVNRHVTQKGLEEG